MLVKYEKLNRKIQLLSRRTSNSSDELIQSETITNDYKNQLRATSDVLRNLINTQTINEVKNIFESDNEDAVLFRQIIGLKKPTENELKEKALDQNDKDNVALFNKLKQSAQDLANNITRMLIEIDLKTFKEKHEALENHNKNAADFIENYNRINLYNRVYQQNPKDVVQKSTEYFNDWQTKFAQTLRTLREAKQNLEDSKQFLQSSKPNLQSSKKLLIEVTTELEKIDKNILKYEKLHDKIVNEDDGLLKTIGDAQEKEYLFIGDGVTYSIRTEQKTKTYYLQENNLDGTQVAFEEKKLKYVTRDKREKEEVGVFEKIISESNDNISRYIVKGDPKSPEWVSERFPHDEKSRWDHALRWANDILQHRSGPPYKPLYLEQGARAPEEVAYLKEALEALLELQKEMRPDASQKTDPNFAKIIVSERKLGLFERAFSGLSSLYNKSTKEEALDEFKKKFLNGMEILDVTDKVKKFKKEHQAIVNPESKKEILPNNSTVITSSIKKF